MIGILTRLTRRPEANAEPQIINGRKPCRRHPLDERYEDGRCVTCCRAYAVKFNTKRREQRRAASPHRRPGRPTLYPCTHGDAERAPQGHCRACRREQRARRSGGIPHVGPGRRPELRLPQGLTALGQV